MGLIDFNKERQTSGGYFRLFGDETIGNFFSSVHAAVISNGTKVADKLIMAYRGQLPIFKGDKVNTAKKTLDIINKNPNGCIIFGGYLKINGKKKEIDVIIFKENDFFIGEIKDGDSLDTKKSTAEIDGIYGASEYLKTLGYECDQGRLILMNMAFKRHQIKDERAETFVMSGLDFCDNFNFDFTFFQEIQKSEAPANRKIMINEMIKILNREGLGVQPLN